MTPDDGKCAWCRKEFSDDFEWGCNLYHGTDVFSVCKADFAKYAAMMNAISACLNDTPLYPQYAGATQEHGEIKR